MNEILNASKAIEEQIKEDRHNLHRKPEVGFDLKRNRCLRKETPRGNGYRSQSLRWSHRREVPC